MEIDSRNITASYRERMQRLALFDPLYRLENKKTTDKSGRPIDYYSLGLLTLLFFRKHAGSQPQDRGAGISPVFAIH